MIVLFQFNGQIYLWGNIAPYVISYYHHFGGKDGAGEPVNLFDAVLFLPICYMIMMFMNPTGAFLTKILHPKILIGVGSLIGVIACLIAARCMTFFNFILAYNVL